MKISSSKIVMKLINHEMLINVSAFLLIHNKKT